MSAIVFPALSLLILLLFWSADALAAALVLRQDAWPGDKLLALRRWARATFWLGLGCAVVFGLPPAAQVDAVGPTVAVLLYLLASLLWALPSYWAARSLRGIPREPWRYLAVEFGARVFPAAPFLLWLLLAASLLALGLSSLLTDPWSATALVAAFALALLLGGPQGLSRLFPRTDPVWNARADALARRAGVRFRRLAVIPTAPVGIANAFVYGAGLGVVFVTDRLLELLEPQEVEAVLAHEFMHVRLRHTWKLALAGLVLPLGARLFPDLAWLVLLAVWALVLALARRFEFQADRAAASLLGSGAPLAAALERLTRADELPARRPRPRSGPLATHPAPEERVRRLLAGP